MSGLVSTLLSALSNGICLTVNRSVLLHISPFIYGFFILGSAGFILGIYSLFKYGPTKVINIVSANWRFLMIMGILSAILNFLLFWGLQLSSAINSAIITRLDIVFAAVIGGMFFGEKLEGLDWIAVIVLILGSLRILEIDIKQFVINKGDILFLLHTFFVALNAIIIRYQLAQVPAMIKASINAISCGLIYFLAIVITHQTAQLANITDFKLPTIIGIMLLLFQYPTYYYGLRKLEVWMVRATFLVMPITSSISSYLFLKEIINLAQLQGMLAVIGGVLILSYRQKLKGEKDIQLKGVSRGRITNGKEIYSSFGPRNNKL